MREIRIVESSLQNCIRMCVHSLPRVKYINQGWTLTKMGVYTQRGGRGELQGGFLRGIWGEGRRVVLRTIGCQGAQGRIGSLIFPKNEAVNQRQVFRRFNKLIFLKSDEYLSIQFPLTHHALVSHNLFFFLFSFST